MVDADIELPSEIWTVILKELLPQDLINCSRTCWVWNTIANPFLYETVYICSEYRHQLFVRTITPCRNHDGSRVCKPCNRTQQLGQLVKAVDIENVDYRLTHDMVGVFTVTQLLELASATPNVHTAKIYIPIVEEELRNGSYFDWSILAARWTKLTSLTLMQREMDCPLEQAELTNCSDILSRIQHLDITNETELHFMLPFLPAKPCLQSFIGEIDSSEDYEALKEISQTYRNTLHTFMVKCYVDVDLDDLKIGSNLLKTVGIFNWFCKELHITNFGDNLEHLEYRGSNSDASRSIIQAMKKTSKLKTLSLVVDTWNLEDIPLVLENNKNTLHTFYFRAYAPVGNANLISLLLANKVQLCNVTTLFFELSTLNNFDVHSLAEIFPNVGFLGLTRDIENHMLMSWITTGDLSHFRHLKAIDEITYVEVLDQNEVTYQKCIIPWDKFWVPPSKKTTVF